MSHNPYGEWLGVDCQAKERTHYVLLGLRNGENDPRRIKEAYERASSKVHQWESSRHGDLATQILHELTDAYLCLRDPRRKVEYDRDLASRNTASGESATSETVVEQPAPQDLLSGLEQYTQPLGGKTLSSRTNWEMPSRPKSTNGLFSQPLAARLALGAAGASVLVVLVLGFGFVLPAMLSDGNESADHGELATGPEIPLAAADAEPLVVEPESGTEASEKFAEGGLPDVANESVNALGYPEDSQNGQQVDQDTLPIVSETHDAQGGEYATQEVEDTYGTSRGSPDDVAASDNPFSDTNGITLPYPVSSAETEATTGPSAKRTSYDADQDPYSATGGNQSFGGSTSAEAPSVVIEGDDEQSSGSMRDDPMETGTSSGVAVDNYAPSREANSPPPTLLPDDIENTEPVNAELEQLIADAQRLIEAGTADEAKIKLEIADREDGTDLRPDFYLGLLEAMINHSFTDARKHFAACARRAPENVACVNNLAIVELHLKDTTDAVSGWRSALELAPSSEEVAHNVAVFLRLANGGRFTTSDRLLTSLVDAYTEASGRASASDYGGFHFMDYIDENGVPAAWRWPNLVDRVCLVCGGRGEAPCPNKSCKRGVIVGKVPMVTMNDPRSGQRMVQERTVRARCGVCGGSGSVTCSGCGGRGTDRDL